MKRRENRPAWPGPRALGPVFLTCLAGAAAADGPSLTAVQPFAEEQTVVPAGSVGALGSAVALNPAADRMLVGDPLDEPNGPASGSATLYVRQSTSWIPVARLEPDVGWAGEEFGSAVALDATGDRLVVGAPDAYVSSVESGAVYVFDRSGPVWVQTARLVDAAAVAFEDLGASVALSPDGNVLAVGAPGARRIRIWEHDGTAWQQQLGLQSYFGQFGFAVALDASGTRFAVGAPEATGGGRVMVFDRQPGQWVGSATLQPLSVGEGERFGAALAFDAAATTLFVGVDAFNGSAGTVSVCQDFGGTWAETAQLLPSDSAAGARFGAALALDTGSDHLVVGAPDDATEGSGAGAAYLFELDAGAWTERERLTVSQNGAGDALGSSVAAGGGRVALGAPGAAPAGRASVLRPALVLYCTGITSSQGCVPSLQLAGAPSALDPAPFDFVVVDAVNNKSGLPFYGVFGAATLPFYGGTLCVSPPLKRTGVVWSGGNPPPDDCSGVFAADFNAVIQSGSDPLLVPGAVVNAQLWYRDPASVASSGVGLSNAVQFEILP